MQITELERREILRYIEMYDFREYLRNKTFLITGAGGICGTGLTKWILLENEVHGCNTQIIASTRNPQADSEYITYCLYGHEKEAADGRKVDYIIHAASPTGNSFHQAHPTETFLVNVGGTERMLEIAKATGAAMVYLSSEEVYGVPQDSGPIKEDYAGGGIDSLSLRNSYPLAKKGCELLCCGAASEYGVNVKIIRLSTIHGLFQSRELKIANEILNCIIEGRDLHMKTAGMTRKCTFYTLDAISAIFLVLFKGKNGSAYNVSNPDTFMTMKDMANHLFQQFAPELKIVFEQGADITAMGFLPRRTLVQDISKIRELGWEPKTGLDEIYRIDIERIRGK